LITLLKRGFQKYGENEADFQEDEKEVCYEKEKGRSMGRLH